MYGTDDWQITEIEEVEGEWYDEVLQAKYEMDPTEKQYILDSDHLVSSTRSTIARNMTDIRPAKDSQFRVSDSEIRREFVVKHFSPPIDFQEGDEVLRLIAYNDDDRLTGETLERHVEDQEGSISDERWMLPLDGIARLKDDRSAEIPLSALEGDKNRYLEFSDLNSNHTPQEEQLYTTPQIRMPEDVWGLITGVKNGGYGEHFFSPAIDPGFQDRLVVEIGNNYELPPISWPEEGGIEVELYSNSPL